MTQRSDAPFIKHLTQTYGPETAREWQRPPLVVLPGEGFVQYVNAHEEAWSAEQPTLPYLPWDDVTFDFADGQKGVVADIHRHITLDQEAVESNTYWERYVEGTGGNPEATREQLKEALQSTSIDYVRHLVDMLPQDGLWIRVRTIGSWLSHASLSMPWNIAVDKEWLRSVVDHPDEWLFIEMWDKALTLDQIVVTADGNRVGGVSGKFLAHPLQGFVSRVAADRIAWVECRRPDCKGCRIDAQLDALRVQQVKYYLYLISATLRYLLRCDEYLTEVKPAPLEKPLPANQQKVHQAKPWLNEQLRHYILLDPTRVAEYGHPSGMRAAVGHHASPHPHTRRGHWAVLKHERFARDDDGMPKRVWVKQAWVGATEWTNGLNQRYRVVLPDLKVNEQQSALAGRKVS